MTPEIRHEIVGPEGSAHSIRLAHLSDLHLWFSSRKLPMIERRAAAWAPDVWVLTGDLADTPMGQRLSADWIRRLAEVRPVCWVAGNHDRWWGRGFLDRLAAVPNAHAIDRRDAWIEGKGGRLFRFTSLERMDPSKEAAAAPTIVPLHDPGAIRPAALEGLRNHVLLAGHLHGGQIVLWRDRRGRPQPAGVFYGRIEDRSLIHRVPLIVSRGLGDTLPLRIGAPREIVIVDFFPD
jgi:predicted MPP superfamily phosphohydrolase